MDIQSAYAQHAELLADDEQRAVVERLAELQRHLHAAGDKSSTWWSKWWPHDAREPVRGIYLWGDVGRGKTFLMDLFFATLATEQKRRAHFHRLMSDVHRQLGQLNDIESPLDVVAGQLAKKVRVLCFDEFFVNDIGDAMILAQLLRGLFRRGVTLVATSNLPPAELYRDGLQRSRFLPAIELLETHTDVVPLGDGPDYRLRALTQAGTYLLTDDAETPARLESFFARLAPDAKANRRTLEILGRQIEAIRACKGVAWFDFQELCAGPRSQEDYIEIARCYETVILSSIPALTRSIEDAARRFIALVDEFYDRRVKLVISAALPLDSLYQGARLQFEFQRTVSRLTEMQSETYLHAAHLA